MATPNRSEAELANELQAEKDRAEAQVTAAGEAARQAAEAQGIPQEEVTKRVEEARKQEKDKLYPQLEALKESIKEIQQTLREEREEKENIKREAEAAKEAQRLATLSDSERTLEAMKRIEEQLSEERKARLKLEDERQEEKRQSSLEKYRLSVIRDAGDEIIPELVAGKSEEEIDASVHTAKARYEELAERFKSMASGRVKGNMPRSTSPNTEALEEEELEERVTTVDPHRYRTDPDYREKIKGEMEKEYMRLHGRV